jgi:glutamyl-tRNA reductase
MPGGEPTGTGGRLLVVGADHRAAVLRGKPGLDAEAATRLLVNRLLHAPSEVLRALAASGGEAAQTAALVRRLFRVGGEEGDVTR